MLLRDNWPCLNSPPKACVLRRNRLSGWSGALMGMMTLVRVLPSDKYEEVMTKVREGRPEKTPRSQPPHKHGG